MIADGPYAGDGRLSPFKSEFVRGFDVTDRERSDLLAFLHALTDETVVSDPALANPFITP
jgi:cytochrome c peroxidase